MAGQTNTVPYSRNMDPTYENFGAQRPHCGENNIFNRASDLQTFQPIGFRTVNCQACDCQFNINNDSVNAAHQMLLTASYGFVERKQYMQCVLSVAQAYEIFFGHFLYIQLVYRAFANDDSRDPRCLKSPEGAALQAPTTSHVRSHATPFSQARR